MIKKKNNKPLDYAPFWVFLISLKNNLTSNYTKKKIRIITVKL